jgi:hypothetical protein
LPSLPRSLRNRSPEREVVYGTLTNSDIGQAPDKVPGMLQSIGASQVTGQHGGTVLEVLGSQATGVGLSDSQGKSMFEDCAITASRLRSCKAPMKASRFTRTACG